MTPVLKSSGALPLPHSRQQPIVRLVQVATESKSEKQEAPPPPLSARVVRRLRYCAALLSPCRDVRMPICMSLLRIEWDA